MTMACNLSFQLANATVFVFNQAPNNVFQFTVISMRNRRIRNTISPLKNVPRTPIFLSSVLSNLSARRRRSIYPSGKSGTFMRNVRCPGSLFPRPAPGRTLPAMSAFEMFLLQVANMETAFTADRRTQREKSHLESQPALPGDPVLGLCKVKDRPLQPGIYAFKMLISSYETIKYFLQQQQVSTESVLNI